MDHLAIDAWGFHASANGLTAIVALTLIVVLLIGLRFRR